MGRSSETEHLLPNPKAYACMKEMRHKSTPLVLGVAVWANNGATGNKLLEFES